MGDKITLGQLLSKRRKELEGFMIEIDKDPSNKSLAILYRQRSRIKAWAQRCTSMYNEATQFKTKCERDFEQKKLDHNRKIKDLLMNDKNVKEQKSNELRIAAAENMSIESADLLIDSKKRLLTTEGYFSEIANKLRDLFKTLEAIDSQDRTIKTMVYLGEIRAKRSMGTSNKKLLGKDIEDDL